MKAQHLSAIKLSSGNVLHSFNNKVIEKIQVVTLNWGKLARCDAKAAFDLDVLL